PGGIAGPYDGVPAEGFNLQGNSPGARSRQAFPGARPGLPGPPVAPLLLPAVEAAAGHIYLSQCPDGQGDLPGRDPQARNPELDGNAQQPPRRPGECAAARPAEAEGHPA